MLFNWELRPCWEFSSMFTVLHITLVGICIFDCFFGLQLDYVLILRKILLKQEALELSQNALDTVCGWPSRTLLSFLVELNHVQTNIVSKDIWMWNWVEQCDGWGMIGIALRELQLYMKYASFIKSSFRTSHVSMPSEQVMVQRTGNNTNSWDCLFLNLLEILYQSFVGKSLDFFVDSCSKQCLISRSSLFLHLDLLGKYIINEFINIFFYIKDLLCFWANLTYKIFIN